MSGYTLLSYLMRAGQTQSELSREIGHARSKISYWIKNHATVELTEAGIKIRLPSGLIVHESQVSK